MELTSSAEIEKSENEVADIDGIGERENETGC